MAKLYGSLTNRIMEGHIYNEDGKIHEGDDINMYYWSDVRCFFVTEVENPKRIKVREYEVVADRSKPGGIGHQDWLYFKKNNELHEYLNRYGIKDCNRDPYEIDAVDTWCSHEQTWVFRYNGWWKEYHNGDGKKCYHKLEKISIGKDIRAFYYDWTF